MSVDTDDAVRKLFKSGAILFLGLGIELGISFIAKVIIARVLGSVDYGVVSLGITAAAVLSTISVLGLNVGIARNLPRHETHSNRLGVVVSGFELALPVSIAVGGIITLGASTIATTLFNEPAVTPVLQIFGIAIPFAAVMKLVIGTIQGLKRSLPKVLIQNIAYPVVRFGGIIVALFFGLGTIGVAWAYLFSYAIAAFLGIYLLWSRTSFLIHDAHPSPMRRELLRFSLPLMVSAAMTLVFSDIDTFMLGFFSDTGDVGIYNTVYPLAFLLTATISSFSFVFMPIVSQLYNDGRDSEVKRLYQIVTKWILVATLPVFLVMVLFPTQVIELTFGSEYSVGSLTLVVLAVGFFSHSVLGPNVNTLTSIGETRTIMYINGLTAVVNIVLNALLIPRYTFLGAAVATTISYLLLNALYSMILYQKTGIVPINRSAFLPTSIGVILAVSWFVVVERFIPANTFTLLGGGLSFILLYFLAILRFGIEKEEVMLILSFEERFDVDIGAFKPIAKRIIEER